MTADTVQISSEVSVEQIGQRLIGRLPEAASQALPSRGQVAVTGTLKNMTNELPIETVLEPDGDRGHWVSFTDAQCTKAALNAGDTVTLTVQVAETWPEPVTPDDLREALAEAPDTAELWASITPMARWEWVRWVQATRNETTRARRVEVSISKLRDGKRRPCCFNLASCTDPELAKSGKLVAQA